MSDDDRVMPHDLDAERSVIGACFIGGAARVADALEVVKSGMFYRDAHRRIFDAMSELAKQNGEIDFVTVKSYLQTIGDLENCGGPAYLSSCADGGMRSTNVEHYGRIVRSKWQLREAIYLANKIASDAYDGEREADEILDRAAAAIDNVSISLAPGAFVRLGELFDDLLENIEKWSQAKAGITGLSTGFPAIDEITRGLQPANLILLAGRPSMGKSSLAENIGRFVAKGGGVVAKFNLETSKDEEAVRAVSGEGRVDAHLMQAGRISERAYGRLAHAIGVLQEIPVYINDEGSVSALDVRAKCRRLKREAGRLDLVIVDYVQLMEDMQARSNDNRTIALAATSRMLKRIAKELHVPMLVLSQLSRDLERRPNKRPILADLRDSGALEQDADLVWFIFRPVVYEEEPTNGTSGNYGSWEPDVYRRHSELIVAKQRNGPKGTVFLEFHKESTQFTSAPVDNTAEQTSLAGF